MIARSRYFKYERLFAILEAIASRRFGVSIDRLHECMNDRFSTCHRTTRRDVLFLESIRLLRRVKSSYGVDTFVFDAESTGALGRQLAQQWQETQSEQVDQNCRAIVV